MAGYAATHHERLRVLLEVTMSELGGDLLPAEAAILRAVAKGEVADLSNYVPEANGPTLGVRDEQGKYPAWGVWEEWLAAVRAARRVRAAFLKVLLTHPHAREQLSDTGVLVMHAIVDDAELVLDFCRLDVPLVLVCCVFTHGISLRCARTATLSFDGTHTMGFAADGVEVGGSVFLRNGFSSRGQVRLLGAKITGNLDCDGATLVAGEKDNAGNLIALFADGVEVGGSVFLRNGFSSKGQVRLLGAKITGDLDCDGATLVAGENDNPRDLFALVADGVEVGGSVFLRHGFSSKGQVRLLGAKITGNLACAGAKLDAGKRDNAGNLFALAAERMEVGGGVFLRHGFSSRGQVRLLGAKITGDLACAGATLDAGEKDNAGNLVALTADGVEVGGSVFLCQLSPSAPTTIHGDVTLPSARVTKFLLLQGLRHQPAEGQPRPQLQLIGAHIGDELTFAGGNLHYQPSNVDVILLNCKVNTLRDSEQAWGDDTVRWHVDGFVYEHIAQGSPVTHRSRRAWLKKNPSGEEFSTQPHRHLAMVQERMGYASEARETRVCMERLRHRHEHPVRAARREWKPLREGTIRLLMIGAAVWRVGVHACKWAMRFPYAWATAYGYKPWKAIVWMGLLWLFGAWLFGTLREFMSPSSGDVLVWLADKPGRTLEQEMPSYPRFSPALYSLDSMLPLVNLHQEEHWLPDAGKGSDLVDISWYFGTISSGRLLRWYHWLHIAMGWSLSTLAAVGFLGVMTRDKAQDEQQA